MRSFCISSCWRELSRHSILPIYNLFAKIVQQKSNPLIAPISALVQAQGSISSIDGLAGALSPPALPDICLGDAGASQGRPVRSAQRPATKEFHVWRVTTEGSRVYSGTVELPERSILLLTGHGVHFHGTSFRGMPLCRCHPCLRQEALCTLFDLDVPLFCKDEVQRSQEHKQAVSRHCSVRLCLYTGVKFSMHAT